MTSTSAQGQPSRSVVRVVRTHWRSRVRGAAVICTRAGTRAVRVALSASARDWAKVRERFDRPKRVPFIAKVEAVGERGMPYPVHGRRLRVRHADPTAAIQSQKLCDLTGAAGPVHREACACVLQRICEALPFRIVDGDILTRRLIESSQERHALVALIPTTTERQAERQGRARVVAPARHWAQLASTQPGERGHVTVRSGHLARCHVHARTVG